MAEVERGWLRQVFLGEDLPDLYDRSADEDADFNDVDQADPAEAFNDFEQAFVQAADRPAGDGLAVRAGLDQRPSW